VEPLKILTDKQERYLDSAQWAEYHLHRPDALDGDYTQELLQRRIYNNAFMFDTSVFRHRPCMTGAAAGWTGLVRCALMHLVPDEPGTRMHD
jgi:hypothetical protein